MNHIFYDFNENYQKSEEKELKKYKFYTFFVEGGKIPKLEKILHPSCENDNDGPKTQDVGRDLA